VHQKDQKRLQPGASSLLYPTCAYCLDGCRRSEIPFTTLAFIVASAISSRLIHLLCRLSSPKRNLLVLFCPPAFPSFWRPSLGSRARGQRPSMVRGRSASLVQVSIPQPAFRGRTSRGSADMILIRWNSNCRILRDVILTKVTRCNRGQFEHIRDSFHPFPLFCVFLIVSLRPPSGMGRYREASV
jgi:hypothetical protein